MNLSMFIGKQRLKMISISYVIPCFNAGNYLLESVQSILNQHGEFNIEEIIVIDDCSTDKDTLHALETLKHNPLVKIIANAGRKGPAGARNTGIAAVKAEWIAFHDADDLVLPNGLAYRVDSLKLFPGAEWVGGDITDINSNGNGDGIGRIAANLDFYQALKMAYKDNVPIRLEKPVKIFIEQAPTNMIVPLIRTDLVRKIGGFDEQIPGQEDLHFYFRLALHSDFIYVPKIVSAYRKHENNTTGSRVKTMHWELAVLDELLVRREFSYYKSLIKKRAHKVALSINYAERAEGRFSSAVTAGAHAIRFDYFSISAWKSLFAAIVRKR